MLGEIKAAVARSVDREMAKREKAIWSVACPCCASTVVELRGASKHHMSRPLGPLVWTCTFCGFALMGLAVPVRPASYAERWLTCLEVLEATDVDPAYDARVRLGLASGRETKCLG